MSDFRIRGALGLQTQDFRRGVNAGLADLRRLRAGYSQTAVSSRVLEAQERRLNDALQEQRRQVRALTGDYIALRRAMFTLAIRSTVVGFASLNSVLFATGAALANVVSQAGLASAALGTAGLSSVTALAQGMSVLKLATEDVGKALNTAGQEHEKALSKLTTPARAFVGEMRGLQDDLREVRLLAQEGLFPGLVEGFREATPIIEPFKQAVFDTAQTLGYLAETAGELAGSKGFANDLNKLGQRNTITLRKLGEGAIEGLDGLRTFAVEGDGLIAHITEGWRGLGVGFNDMVKDAKKDGSLRTFFRESEEAYDRLTSTVGRGGETILNVLRASHPVAERMAEAMNDAAKGAERYTDSEAGQKRILTYFENIEPVTNELGSALRDTLFTLARLGEAGAGNAERMIRGYREELLPIVEDLALSLNDGVLPAVIEVVDELVDLLRAASPALKIMGQITAQIVRGIAQVLDMISTLTGRIGGVGGGFATLAIGALAIKSWKSLSDLIALSLLRLRQLVGLAPRIGALDTGTRGVPGQTGLPGAPGSPGRPGGARGSTRPGLTQGGGGRFLFPTPQGMYTDRLGERVGRATPRSVALSNLTQRRFQGDRVAPMPFHTGASRTARQRLDAQSFDRVGVVPRREKVAAALSGIPTSMKDGMVSGARRAAQPLGGIMRATVATAAISGLISGAANPSSKQGIKAALQNVVSGLTFGIAESKDAEQNRLTERSARFIQTRTSNAGPLNTAADVQEFRTTWLKALRDGKDITDEQFRELDRRAKALQTKLASIGKGSGADRFGLGKLNPDELTGPITQLTEAMRRLNQAGSADIKLIRDRVKFGMEGIAGSFKEGGAAAKKATSRLFGEARAAIQRNMASGVISAKEGAAELKRIFRQELAAYGFDKKQAAHIAAGRRPDGGPSEAGSGGKARGGLMTLGRPGESGPDNVPIRATAARGEDVVVFNRHQRKIADARFADMGGLPGLFRTVNQEHQKPKAGLGRHVRAFARGGMVTGDTDYRPQLGRALSEMANATNQRIDVRSGGRTMAEQAALYARYLAGTGNLAAKPNANAPHVRGIAADINPGRERFGGVASKFGLGFTVPSESWHIELLRAIAGTFSGAAGGGASGGVMRDPKVRRVLTEMTGPTGELVQAGLDNLREGALDKLREVAGMAGGGVGGGTATGNGSALMKKISESRGWNFDHWWELDRRESSHGANLANPTSTARLRGQFLDFNWGKYGPGSDPRQNPSMGQQIEAMAAYIAERYGNPSKALSHHNANNWYAEGGIIPRALASAQRPDTGGGRPTVDPRDAIPPGSSKPKKPRKRKKVVAAPGAPRNLEPVTLGGATAKLGKIKQPKVSARVKALLKKMKSGKLEDVFELQKALQIQRMMDSKENRFTVLEGQAGLTDEFPVVQLEDTEDFRDLTNYLNANPAALRGTANVDEFKDKYGDALEVVNWGGMTVQGKYLRGINHRVLGELDPMIALRDSIGLDGQALNRVRHGAQVKVGEGILERVRRVNAINRVMKSNVKMREDTEDDIRRERKGGMTWQEAIRANERRISKIQDYRADLSNAPDDVKFAGLGGADGKRRQTAKWIEELRNANEKLRRDKPKGGRPKRLRALYDQFRQINRENTVLTGDEEGKGDAGFRGAINDQLVEWRTANDENNLSILDLKEVGLPSLQLSIDTLAKEKGELLGTTIPSPRLTDNAAERDKARTEEINALLKAENIKLKQANLLAGAQFSTLQGVGGMVSGRFLGSFAQGGVLSQDGVAMVHRHERMTVEPDPEGPFGSRAGASGAPGRMALDLTVRLDDGGLLKVIDARVDGKAQDVTSRSTGRRARLIAAAPGR